MTGPLSFLWREFQLAKKRGYHREVLQPARHYVAMRRQVHVRHARRPSSQCMHAPMQEDAWGQEQYTGHANSCILVIIHFSSHAMSRNKNRMHKVRTTLKMDVTGWGKISKLCACMAVDVLCKGMPLPCCSAKLALRSTAAVHRGTKLARHRVHTAPRSEQFESFCAAFPQRTSTVRVKLSAHFTNMQECYMDTHREHQHKMGKATIKKEAMD